MSEWSARDTTGGIACFLFVFLCGFMVGKGIEMMKSVRTTEIVTKTDDAWFHPESGRFEWREKTEVQSEVETVTNDEVAERVFLQFAELIIAKIAEKESE